MSIILEKENKKVVSSSGDRKRTHLFPINIVILSGDPVVDMSDQQSKHKEDSITKKLIKGLNEGPNEDYWQEFSDMLLFSGQPLPKDLVLHVLKKGFELGRAGGHYWDAFSTAWMQYPELREELAHIMSESYNLRALFDSYYKRHILEQGFTDRRLGMQRYLIPVYEKKLEYDYTHKDDWDVLKRGVASEPAIAEDLKDIVLKYLDSRYVRSLPSTFWSFLEVFSKAYPNFAREVDIPQRILDFSSRHGDPREAAFLSVLLKNVPTFGIEEYVTGRSSLNFDTHDEFFPALVEKLLGDRSNLRRDHALLLALALHQFDTIPGIHIERELPARQLVISSLLAPHRTSASEIMGSPLLRKLVRLYGHYLGVDLHDLTVNLRDAVIMAQRHGVMDNSDRDFFHNRTPRSDEDRKQYVQRAREIYERTKDPSAYLVYVISRVFGKNTPRDALAHVVALNSSLRKGGLERDAHELIHRHKDLIERALNGDKNAIAGLRKLVNLARLRELLIQKNPDVLHNLGLNNLQNITPQKWDEILEKAKTDKELQEHVSIVQFLPIASTLSTDQKYTLSKLLRQKRFERENMGAYEALIHAIQTGEVARRLTTKIDKLPTHRLFDSLLKILYVDGAIDEKTHDELVKKLRSADNKNLLDAWNEVAHRIQSIVHENYHQPFAAVGDLHEVPQTSVETFVGRALDELQKRIEYHARNARMLENPSTPRKDAILRRVWYANHKYNDRNLLKKPPEHPFKLLREIK